MKPSCWAFSPRYTLISTRFFDAATEFTSANKHNHPPKANLYKNKNWSIVERTKHNLNTWITFSTHHNVWLRLNQSANTDRAATKYSDWSEQTNEKPEKSLVQNVENAVHIYHWAGKHGFKEFTLSNHGILSIHRTIFLFNAKQQMETRKRSERTHNDQFIYRSPALISKYTHNYARAAVWGGGGRKNRKTNSKRISLRWFHHFIFLFRILLI